MVDRLLFADALKIIGIALIVFYHITTSGIYPWLGQYEIPAVFSSPMYQIYYGSIGVTIFIFASGLCLTLNHPSLNSKQDIKNFYARRILRIYPAYWMAILFTLALNQSLLNQPFSALDVFRNISGFQAFGVTTFEGFWGQINPTFWFIGLIVSLYLLFPLLLYSMNRHPHVTVISLLLISVASRYCMTYLSPFYAGTVWFPLCNVFAFGLGVFLIKKDWYPKKPSTNVAVIYLSNLTFYIYLTHGPILGLVSYPVIFLCALLVVGSMFYVFDKNLKQFLEATYQKIAAYLWQNT